MRTSGSFQLLRVFGIRIGADVSWFFVLFLFIFWLSGSFRSVLGGARDTAYVVAVASALLFFLSIVLHELGHALVARRLGIETLGIDLWFFGGIAKLRGEAQSPGAEFKIAAAGPLVTLAIVGLCVGSGTLLSGWTEFWNAATLNNATKVTPGLLLLSWLASINMLVLAFNLVPAFPLDGGRIARAAAWKLTGDRTRATRAAARLGQGFAYLVMGYGVFVLVAYGSFFGVTSLVLGWFLLQGARSGLVDSGGALPFAGLTVADVMDPEPVAIPGELSVARAYDEFFLRYREPWFPVIDGRGHFVGVARESRVAEAERSGDSTLLVRDVLDAEGERSRIDPAAPLDELLGSEHLRSQGAVAAVDRDGFLRGTVTLERLKRALQAQAQAQAREA